MLKRLIRGLFRAIGYEIVRKSPRIAIADRVDIVDMDKEFMQIYKRCEPYTMTSIERMYALYKATRYIAQHNIPGDFVECGVWKGGSLMLCALTLIVCGDTRRKIYLYDTYAGPSQPTEMDVDILNLVALENWRKMIRKKINEWGVVSLEEVEKNMISTNYPRENLIFAKGKVEEKIPATIPDKIALLRLDTDWYESTYHELVHLFPRLFPGGVIIIDDYGEWKGCRAAVDRYFKETGTKILLHRIDSTGRIGIKLAAEK